MTKLKDKVVAITGAGSGIGRALAQKAVARGAHVALSDVNEGGLAETVRELGTKTKVSTHVVDVRDKQAMFDWAANVEQAHGGADVIINNAGVAARDTIEDMSYERLELVIDVCLWGVIHGVKAFFPLLRKRPEGHIVNISSINAYVPFHRNGPYNAAKAAVLGLSETLMMELTGQSIAVSVVHPGGIKTNIAHNSPGVSEKAASNFTKYAAMTSAASCAEQILKGVERNQKRIYVGLDAKVMHRAKLTAPDATVAVSGKLSDMFG